MGDKRKMTVLEKIKGCVSLVWDFQEFYSEEDIEEFCRNELHTYPQHDEIMEYFKHIEELEEENERLKGDLELYESGGCRATNLFECGVVKELKEQLAKANLLLKDVYKIAMDDWNDPKWHDQVLRKAREYLKEIEKCQSQKQH